MNQLELILENIRLSHIEKILLESSTQQEAQRGIDLINESIYTIGTLMEEMSSNRLSLPPLPPLQPLQPTSNQHQPPAYDHINELIKSNQAKLNNIERLKSLRVNKNIMNPSSSLINKFHSTTLRAS